MIKSSATDLKYIFISNLRAYLQEKLIGECRHVIAADRNTALGTRSTCIRFQKNENNSERMFGKQQVTIEAEINHDILSSGLFDLRFTIRRYKIPRTHLSIENLNISAV